MKISQKMKSKNNSVDYVKIIGDNDNKPPFNYRGLVVFKSGAIGFQYFNRQGVCKRDKRFNLKLSLFDRIKAKLGG